MGNVYIFSLLNSHYCANVWDDGDRVAICFIVFMYIGNTFHLIDALIKFVFLNKDYLLRICHNM